MRNYEDYLKTDSKIPTLWTAAKTGDIWFLRSLIGDGSGLNKKDHKGYSPLMYAAYHGHVDLVEHLIERGADVNSADSGGNSILMGAAFKGHTEVVNILVQAGADQDLKNQEGLRAVDFARMFGRFDLVQKLENKKTSRAKMLFQSAAHWLTYANKKLTQRNYR